ncbi:MAG TPA: Hsp20/alpha crystallin family protein [Candidatus Fimimorpha excrementavium]|nr:Hsp20/alpha crystallin family protein [Candidatus Fimimorpha excrementavium]
MLMPSIFGESLLDDFFRFPFESYDRGYRNGYMSTDIKDTDQGYELTMNMPGVKKEDVKAELKDGYLTIQASTNQNRDEKDNEGNYIRRERYSGTFSRSFYVGEEVKQEEIKAKFEDGTLKLLVPKKEEKPAVEDKKYISIEG